MKQYRLEATPAVELDVEATFDWYEREEAGLGSQFLVELRAAYARILDHPLGYQDLRAGSSSRVNSPISARDLLFD